jgi:hypothetical protein
MPMAWRHRASVLYNIAQSHYSRLGFWKHGILD